MTKKKYSTLEELKEFKRCEKEGVIFIKDPYRIAKDILILGIIGIVIPVIPALAFIPAGIGLFIWVFIKERFLKW